MGGGDGSPETLEWAWPLWPGVRKLREAIAEKWRVEWVSGMDRVAEKGDTTQAASQVSDSGLTGSGSVKKAKQFHVAMAV